MDLNHIWDASCREHCRPASTESWPSVRFETNLVCYLLMPYSSPSRELPTANPVRIGSAPASASKLRRAVPVSNLPSSTTLIPFLVGAVVPLLDPE
jgi:hypothetical protein